MLHQFLVGNLEVFRKIHTITTLIIKVKIEKRKKKKEIFKIKKSQRLINLFSGSKRTVANSLHLIYIQENLQEFDNERTKVVAYRV